MKNTCDKCGGLGKTKTPGRLWFLPFTFDLQTCDACGGAGFANRSPSPSPSDLLQQRSRIPTLPTIPDIQILREDQLPPAPPAPPAEQRLTGESYAHAKLEQQRQFIACMEAINELRQDEGDSVHIMCDNPEPPPNVAIECCGYWTGWKDRRFEGDNLLACLTAAVAEYRKAQAPK